QAMGWAVAYAGFAALSICAALRALNAGLVRPDARERPAGTGAVPTLAAQALWTALAASSSLLLLAVAGHITRQIAPAPLLGVVPLGAYLLTFVLCFEWPRLYWRPAWLVLLPGVLVGIAYLSRLGVNERSALWRVSLFAVALLVCCMVCHGEIARRRPGAPFL